MSGTVELAAGTDRRRQWIALLARLCRPLQPDEATVALSAMLPLLADLPDGAFCRESLEAVARSSARGVPTYGALRHGLDAWRREGGGSDRSAPASPVVGESAWHPESEAAKQTRRDAQRAESAESWQSAIAVRASVAGVLALVCDRCRSVWGSGEAVDGEVCRACGAGRTIRHPYQYRLGCMLAAILARDAPQHLALCLPEWISAEAERRAARNNVAPERPVS